jgi:glycosyltransferase involved in cell wall biosynthesis
LTRHECLEKLANADVLVLPSKGLFEAFPYAVLEAMAASRPVISTARGAIQEMLAIDGRRPCGLLVKAGDVAELRTAMERIISNPLLGHELGRCGRQRVSELYDSRVVVKSLLKVWFPTRQ